MSTINPLSGKEQTERIHKDRSSAVELMCVQADMLKAHYDKRKEVSHQIVQRITQKLLSLVATIRMDDVAPERLEKKLYEAGTGDSFTVHVSQGKIYIEGYFDLSKLHKSLLW